MKNSKTNMKEKVMESLKDHFRPEFLNRLDEIIVFDILSEEAILGIVKLRIKVVEDRLKAKNISLRISSDAMLYLAREGYNPHYGARPLNRLIQNKILNPVASYIISSGVKKGDEFAILTNIIHQEWSGLSVVEHKKLKDLKSHNLRDHMSEVELIFTALAEVSTRQIAENIEEELKYPGEIKVTVIRETRVTEYAR